MKIFTTIRPLFVVGCLVISIWSCTKKETVTPTPSVVLVNYATDIKPIFVLHCTPCHLSVTGGFKVNKWDDFVTAKTNIGLVLERVQRDVTAAGFMPRAGSNNTALSKDEIAKLKQWVIDGLTEKQFFSSLF